MSYEKNETSLDFLKVLSFLWSKKIIIVLVTGIMSIASIFYALSLPNYYQSSALLAPAEQNSSSSLLGQYSGLASMAGISLPSNGEENKTDMAIAILQSRKFLEVIASEIKDFAPIIIASEKYDQENNIFTFDEELYNEKTKEWVRDVKPPQTKEPSLLEIHKVYNSEVFSYSLDKNTGYISLSIELLSPVHAYDFLNILISKLNLISRQDALVEADKSLGFLQDEFAKTSQISVRDSITNLTDMQLKKKMMAEVNQDYLLKVIDPPFIPEFKTRPSRAMICIIGFLFGLIISISWIFIIELIRKREL